MHQFVLLLWAENTREDGQATWRLCIPTTLMGWISEEFSWTMGRCLGLGVQFSGSDCKPVKHAETELLRKFPGEALSQDGESGINATTALEDCMAGKPPPRPANIMSFLYLDIQTLSPGPHYSMLKWPRWTDRVS